MTGATYHTTLLLAIARLSRQLFRGGAWGRSVYRAAFMAICVVGSCSASAQDQHYEAGTLHNGLRYIIVPSKKMPGQIALGIKVFTGAAYEGNDEIGAAHLVEHMLASYFTGPSGKRLNLLEHPTPSLTSPKRDASTGSYATSYRFNLPKQDLTAGLSVMREIANGSDFSPTEVSLQRKLVAAEFFWPDKPEGEAALEHMTQFRQRSAVPYPATSSSYRNAVKMLTHQRIQGFYNKWYVPKNEIVYVTGDIDLARTRDLIVKLFSNIKSYAVPQPPSVSPGEFKYLYYKSKSDKYSKAYVLYGFTGGEAQGSGILSNLLDDAVNCMKTRIDEAQKDEREAFWVEVRQGSERIETLSGFEVSVVARPSDLVAAFDQIAGHAAYCRDALKSGEASGRLRDATADATKSDVPDTDSVIASLIENSSAYEEPTLRNYLRGVRDAREILSVRSRNELLNRLFAPDRLKVAGFDPADTPSILASEAAVRSALAPKSYRTARANSERSEKTLSGPYALGQTLIAALGSAEVGLEEAGERIGKSNAAGHSILVRSSKGYLDLQPDLVARGRELANLLATYRNRASGPAPEFKIKIGPTESSYTIATAGGVTNGLAKSLRAIQVDESEMLFHRFKVVTGLDRLSFDLPNLDDQIAYHYLATGRIIACPTIPAKTWALDYGQYDRIIGSIFGRSHVSITVPEKGEAKVRHNPRQFDVSSDVELAPVDYNCRLGDSKFNTLRLFLKPKNGLPQLSDDDRKLASWALFARLFGRLREQEGIVYMPGVGLLKNKMYGSITLTVDMRLLSSDVERVRSATLSELKKVATDGVSDRDLLAACQIIKVVTCADPVSRKVRINALFSAYVNAKPSWFSFVQ